jgi:UDP-N-acetylmuramoyl-tripeptide--D-alanyl-D-alanine ligase
VPLTAGEMATAAGGRVVRGDARRPIDGISIDSRTLVPGDFFIAIRGERFDGHQFVRDAIARGAIGVAAEAPIPDTLASPGGAEPVVIAVSDTTAALQRIARHVRRQSGARVVAITGSAGKTTTKEVVAEFLSSRYRVFRNKGNLNNHIGLPLSLLELRWRPEVAVVELGMNHPGEIRTLVGIAEADVRVWTNVGDAHLGFFASADAIADAKAEILEEARPSDVLVANADDPRITARMRAFTGRVVTFGIQQTADVYAERVVERGLEGTHAAVRTPAGHVEIETPLLGLGNLANVLAATAVSLEFGIELTEIRARAGMLRPAARRGELFRLPGGITLIDDSYNSSPSALRRALRTLQTATGSARKVAVLGEMLELGAHSIRLHEECGAAAAEAGLDVLIAVGGSSARALADSARRAGIPSSRVSYVSGNEEAAQLALRLIRPGDLVLVKGSRGIGTDLVADRLKAEYA